MQLLAWNIVYLDPECWWLTACALAWILHHFMFSLVDFNSNNQVRNIQDMTSTIIGHLSPKLSLNFLTKISKAKWKFYSAVSQTHEPLWLHYLVYIVNYETNCLLTKVPIWNFWRQHRFDFFLRSSVATLWHSCLRTMNREVASSIRCFDSRVSDDRMIPPTWCHSRTKSCVKKVFHKYFLIE